jgi:hypothetical protein
MGRLAKTDALDAKAIALFAEQIRSEARPLLDPEQGRLAELASRGLQKQCTRDLDPLLDPQRTGSNRTAWLSVSKSLKRLTGGCRARIYGPLSKG